MSVIVKDMKFPNNCAECERWSICKCLKEYKDYESILYAVDDGDLVRADDCPLIELPPHGRLIDADELANKTFYSKTSAPYITYKKFCDAPTVIEGSET